MHTDPELLSLFALGEDPGDDARAHVQSCASCAEELSELRRVVALGRSFAAQTGLVSPSPDVWTRIRDELALDGAAAAPVEAVEGVGGSSHDFRHELRAHARLAPVEAFWSHASGEAELATDAQGRRVLQVALKADLPTSGLRQAWLIHRDDPAVRQTLGILDGVNGLWTIEHSIDLELYPILDISQQDAGETEHSGQTIVRGELTLVV